MATRNFTQFNTATPLTTSDYIVGYNAAGTTEIKTQVQDIINSVSSLLTPLTLTNTLTGQLVTNTSFSNYQTSVANSTATLLPTTTYQNASGNWESTYTTYQSNSSFYVQSRSTLETPTTGISAVSNIIFLTQATYDALTVKLPTTMYVIVSA